MFVSKEAEGEQGEEAEDVYRVWMYANFAPTCSLHFNLANTIFRTLREPVTADSFSFTECGKRYRVWKDSNSTC